MTCGFFVFLARLAPTHLPSAERPEVFSYLGTKKAFAFSLAK
jgi:hypothetical protein